jgi:hypothetical protein
VVSKSQTWIRIVKRNNTDNGQKKKDKKANNDIQNTGQKTKI